MYTEPQTLIVVYKDELLLNQLRKLVETNDDVEEKSVVGTRDGTINIVSWSEQVWLDNKIAGNINAKVLFLGNIKGTDNLLPVIDVKFEKYGVRYGWAGNQALIHIDSAAINSESDYDAFLDEFRGLPVPDSFRGKEKSSTPPPYVKQHGTSAKKAVAELVAALGYYAAMAAKSFFKDKAMVKRQMFIYGIISMYNNDLETFMRV